MLYIYTLHWNAKEKIKKLHETLLPNLTMDYKWFIKDNASIDSSVEEIESWKNPNINLIKYPNNSQTYSEGMNFLYKESSPKDEDDILYLNNDIVFNDKTSIKNMLFLLKNNVVGVGARLLYNSSNRLQHAGVVFNNIHGTPVHFRVNEESDERSKKNREFQAVTGALFATKAKYLKNLNTNNKSGIPGFDENLRWAFDDIDLCLALKRANNTLAQSMGNDTSGKIVYCGSTNVYHEESFSLKKNPINKLFMNHNVSYFLNKWRDKYKFDANDYKNNFQLGLIK